MPFEGAISRFGLPSTGARPEEFFPQEDEATARYRRFLNTGSDVMPVAPPAGPDLDEEDWAQITASRDPEATLKMVEQLRGQMDVQHGNREIAELDWSNPSKARKDMAGILGKRPGLAQKFGAGVYKMLGMPEPGKGTTTTMTGDPAQFVREFYELNPTDEKYWDNRTALLRKYPAAVEDTRVQSRLNSADSHYHSARKSEAPKEMGVTQQKDYRTAIDGVRSALSRAPDESSKKLAFRERFGRDPKSEEDWKVAWDAAVESNVSKAQRKLDDLVESFGSNVKVPASYGSAPAAKKPSSSAVSASPNVGKPKGLVEVGNLQPHGRKVLQNSDGTLSTASTISVGVGGREYLIPTVVDGVRLSDESAIEHFRKTKQHFGAFDSPESANVYADGLHKEMERGPQINSQEEYDKLPFLAFYIDSNGKPAQKKARGGLAGPTAMSSADPSQYPKAKYVGTPVPIR